MAENWKCRQCAAVNHPKRNECWQCGSDSTGQAESVSLRPISQSSSKFWRNLILIAVALILIIGLVVIPPLVDRRNYRLGVQAVESVECASAIEYFDKIIDGWRLIDFPGYLPSAQEKKEECLALLAAVEAHRLGDYGAALLSYRDFVQSYPDSPLRQTANDLVQMMFAQAQIELLASQETCGEINSFTDIDLFPEPDTNLPLFYLACGGVYNSLGEQADSYQMYAAFLTEYPQHPLAPKAISALALDPQACQEIDALTENPAIAGQNDLIPLMYFGCGKTYDSQALFGDSYLMYMEFLVGYPEHALAQEVEKILLGNSAFCDFFWLTQGLFIGRRDNFLANHYYRCGQAAEEAGEYAEALFMYDHFLDSYADHQLVEKVQAAYASIVVDHTKASKTRELGDPQLVGSTGEDHASVAIYNASPDKIRIVFSGPDAHVEELEACESCRTYTRDETSGPCPEEAPGETYQLAQGDYDVVIELPDDTDTNPFAGEWDLMKGEEYFLCIILVTNE